ncbi:phage tail protein [Hydrogenimonas thermophila]|uniref:Phage tail protein (Tail_P2_I) n=1 Tax=Hydrogenimonas thermophila TaxID=223786 RepID=A0A1I5RPA6_9BACT|nr:phage tail protein [Hydrogenimonas thermophila]SFP60379.1 Phage tail protein (Tail_P2_I) [Hydrogenimonas thermophila]
MLPDYVSEELKAYFEVSSEDRRALLKEELFDDDPLSCDERYLPFFALELGVKIDDLSVPKQREAIANAIDELKRAGTVSYLKNNLKADVENELVELDDFHFRMDLFTQNIDEKFDEVRLGSIRQRVESFKNVRSVFDGVSFKLFFDEQVKVSGASSFKPKINQDANVGFRFEGLGFRTNGTVNTKIELNQVATYELHPTTSILNPTSYILNPTLKKEATIETTLDSINQIQGAMTWQV